VGSSLAWRRFRPASEEAGFAGRGEERRVLMTDFSAAQIGPGRAKLADFLQHKLAGPAAAAADGAVIDAGAFHRRRPSAEPAAGCGDRAGCGLIHLLGAEIGRLRP